MVLLEFKEARGAPPRAMAKAVREISKGPESGVGKKLQHPRSSAHCL